MIYTFLSPSKSFLFESYFFALYALLTLLYVNSTYDLCGLVFLREYVFTIVPYLEQIELMYVSSTNEDVKGGKPKKRTGEN